MLNHPILIANVSSYPVCPSMNRKKLGVCFLFFWLCHLSLPYGNPKLKSWVKKCWTFSFIVSLG